MYNYDFAWLVSLIVLDNSLVGLYTVFLHELYMCVIVRSNLIHYSITIIMYVIYWIYREWLSREKMEEKPHDWVCSDHRMRQTFKLMSHALHVYFNDTLYMYIICIIYTLISSHYLSNYINLCYFDSHCHN